MARPRWFLFGNYDKETNDDGTASSFYFCKSNDNSMSPWQKKEAYL